VLNRCRLPVFDSGLPARPRRGAPTGQPAGTAHRTTHWTPRKGDGSRWARRLAEQVQAPRAHSKTFRPAAGFPPGKPPPRNVSNTGATHRGPPHPPRTHPAQGAGSGVAIQGASERWRRLGRGPWKARTPHPAAVLLLWRDQLQQHLLGRADDPRLGGNGPAGLAEGSSALATSAGRSIRPRPLNRAGGGLTTRQPAVAQELAAWRTTRPWAGKAWVRGLYEIAVPRPGWRSGTGGYDPYSAHPFSRRGGRHSTRFRLPFIGISYASPRRLVTNA